MMFFRFFQRTTCVGFPPKNRIKRQKNSPHRVFVYSSLPYTQREGEGEKRSAALSEMHHHITPRNFLSRWRSDGAERSLNGVVAGAFVEQDCSTTNALLDRGFSCVSWLICKTYIIFARFLGNFLLAFPSVKVKTRRDFFAVLGTSGRVVTSQEGGHAHLLLPLPPRKKRKKKT